MVEVCANDDCPARAAWKGTYDIGKLGSFYWLLRNALPITTGSRKHFFQRPFALPVIPGIFSQTRFHDLARHQLISHIHASGNDAKQQHYQYSEKTGFQRDNFHLNENKTWALP